MARLEQLRSGVSQAWDSVVDGWRQVYDRAAGALTRFRGHAGGELETVEDREAAERSIGWSVLAAEVFDGDSEVTVRLEAPGMDPDDFDVQVVNDALVVRGDKHIEREQTEGHYHVRERAYGSFERIIPLPDAVKEDKASASYKNGVLHISVPKQAERRNKRIRVDVH